MKMIWFIPALLVAASFAQTLDNTNPYVTTGDKCLMTQDGPAAPVISCLFTPFVTATSNTPKYVGPNDSLPMALAAAVPGDLIEVDPASVTTIAGKLALPDGVCQPGKWIQIRSASNIMPGEHVLITPAIDNEGNHHTDYEKYAAKIVLTAQNASLVGGQCLRLGPGIEVTRPAGNGVLYNMYIPGPGSHDVIIDRMFFRGTKSDETQRGVLLNNATRFTIMNSWFDGFQCKALTGACGDSQAIAGGGDTTVQGGPYKIVNNHLEAAGENLIFGGAPASYTPSNIVVAYNRMPKPMSWNPKDPSFDGIKRIVKNCFELKNANQVLFEGNTCGPVWGGFTQVGALILVTPKNQAGRAGSVCPSCFVQNVTIRYNVGHYAAQAVQFGCGPNDIGGWPAACGYLSVHDNFFDHLQYQDCYLCGSFTNLIGGGSAAVPFEHVNVHNLTEVNDGWLTLANDPAGSNGASVLTLGAPLTGNADVHFDNNIVDPGFFGILSTGGGPLNNCFSTPGTNATHIANCWPGGSMTGNQFTYSVTYKGTAWPAGNGTNPNAGANMFAVNAAIAHQQ